MKGWLLVPADVCINLTKDEAFVFLRFTAYVPHIIVALFIHHIVCFSCPSTPALLLLVHHVQFQMDIFTDPKKKADFSEVVLNNFFSLSHFSDFPFRSVYFYPSLSASSPVPDGDDAFPASRQHWPSACGLVPVHLLWLLCQPGAARLSVQLPARHWRVGCTHLWWVVTHGRRRKIPRFDCSFSLVFFIHLRCGWEPRCKTFKKSGHSKPLKQDISAVLKLNGLTEVILAQQHDTEVIFNSRNADVIKKLLMVKIKSYF